MFKGFVTLAEAKDYLIENGISQYEEDFEEDTREAEEYYDPG